MLKINPDVLINMFKEQIGNDSLDNNYFCRIRTVYMVIFNSSHDSTYIDFSSFTVEDIEDTLEDLSCYNDNTGVVLYELNRLLEIRQSLRRIPPTKVQVDFF